MIRAVLLAALVLGSLALFVALPLGALWVAGRVQGATDNLGAAVSAGFVAFLLAVPVFILALGRINSAYQRARLARGLEDTGSFPLETTLVITASLTAVGFAIWFFGFSGAEPLPSVGTGD